MFGTRFVLSVSFALLAFCLVRPVCAFSAPVRSTTVTGFIELDDPNVSCKNVTVILTIRDITLQDVPAPAVTVLKLKNVSSGKKIPFKVQVKNPDPRSTYGLFVLVDVNGDGKISVGDYINQRREPVIEQGQVNVPSVEVRRVD